MLWENAPAELKGYLCFCLNKGGFLQVFRLSSRQLTASQSVHVKAAVSGKQKPGQSQEKCAAAILPRLIFMSPPHNAAHSQHTMGPPVNERCSVIYNITSFQRLRGTKRWKNASGSPVTVSAPVSEVTLLSETLTRCRVCLLCGESERFCTPPLFALLWCEVLSWIAHSPQTGSQPAAVCVGGALLREGGCGWSSTVSGHPWTNWRNVDLNWQWKRRKISLCVVQCSLCLGLFAKLVSYIDFNPSHRNNCSILGRALFGVRANLSAKLGKCIISDTRADCSPSHCLTGHLWLC